MVSTLLLLPALSLPASPGSPPDMARGASLLRGCQAEVRLMALDSLADAAQIDLINGAYCIGYLNGFMGSLPSTPATICTGGGDNMGALVQAYVHFMEHNPPLLQVDKRIGLRKALQASFPCSTAP